jgi:hypothetical protein
MYPQVCNFFRCLNINTGHCSAPWAAGCMIKVALFIMISSLTRKPLSAIIWSPWSIKSINPLFKVICLSEALPHFRHKAYASPGTYSYHNLCSVVFLVVRQCSRYPVFTGRSARPCPSDALSFFSICGSALPLWLTWVSFSIPVTSS